MSTKLAMAENLQAVTARIHAAGNIDEILGEISRDICTVFEADRFMIYLVNEDKTLIVSKNKNGLDSYDDLKLPISVHYNIGGYVALNRGPVNIKDVYDIEELNAYDPPVYFLKYVDKSTGYKTKQVLAAPIFNGSGGNEAIGVVHIINTTSGKPFPKAAEEGAEELCKVLGVAFSQRAKARHVAAKTKYDYLVLDGVITATELDLALRSARRRAADIEQVLMDEFQVKEEAIGQSISKFYRVPYEPFRPDRPKPVALLKKLKSRFVQSQGWMPLEEDDEGLVVLTTEPEHVKRSGIVNQVFPKHKIRYRLCTHREFAATIRHFYGAEDSLPSVDTIIERMEADLAGKPADGGDEKTEPDSATVQLVNKIIVEAHNMRASDIHVEPRHKARTKIRFRVDGSLIDFTEIPAGSHAKLVARLKIMADLDISNRREPQDGKIPFKQFFPPLDIELRVATIPTARGKEDVVLRILTAGQPVPLDQLNLSERNLQALKSLVSKPYGLFLVCGPTGSGKTTTLHAVLGHINTPETKIWTAEDPIEITHESLRQVQINPRADLTFARAMRAFLRADPDVIMVGEMRDKETTAIGIEASLTGHRVLATIHTNSAPESIVRLVDMGMDPFNFADALLGVLAQRLAKRLCANCKKPHVATRDEIGLLVTEYNQELRNTGEFKADPKAAGEAVYAEWAQRYAYDKGQFILYERAGCEACRGTGCSGRIALHELLVATDAIKKNIHEHARVAEVLLTAVNEGMRTLKQDGIEKVLRGILDMHAVRAVCIT